MALKIYPPRNEQGDPQGSSPDPDSTTDVRFWVEATMKAGEVVSVLGTNAHNDALRDLLTEILAEAKEANVHLRHLSGLNYDVHSA